MCAENKSLLHLLDVAHEGDVVEVIECFFFFLVETENTPGTVETQTIEQRIHCDGGIYLKAPELTAALFCTRI